MPLWLYVPTNVKILSFEGGLNVEFARIITKKPLDQTLKGLMLKLSLKLKLAFWQLEKSHPPIKHGHVL